MACYRAQSARLWSNNQNSRKKLSHEVFSSWFALHNLGMSNSHFAKGSGCYTCGNCGKRTRSTGRGDCEHVEMCARCYDMGGDENAVVDGHMTVEEFKAIWNCEPEG